MTIRELLDGLVAYPWLVGAVLALPPVLALLAGLVHDKGRGGRSPWRYLYSVLIYLACVPGMAAAVVTVYSAVFAGENLLDMNLLTSLAPLGTMAATLVLVRRNVSFDEVPGFDRIFGLMLLLAVTFILVIGISKTRIWLFFGASIGHLLLLVVLLILALKWGARLAFGRRVNPDA